MVFSRSGSFQVQVSASDATSGLDEVTFPTTTGDGAVYPQGGASSAAVSHVYSFSPSSTEQGNYQVAVTVRAVNAARSPVTGRPADLCLFTGDATDRHRFAPWKPDGQLVQKMKAKLNLIDSLTRTITAYSNRLQAVLLRYYPQSLELFSDVKTQISLLFLQAYPIPDAAQALSYSDFAAFCRSHHYTHPELLPDVHAHLSLPAPQPDPVIVSAYEGAVLSGGDLT